MRREYSGAATTGNPYRQGAGDDDDPNGAVHIGGIDVIEDIYEEFAKPVTVTINGQTVATGMLTADLGWGYSEYTPMEPDMLMVGEFDLRDHLETFEGKNVTMVVDDGEVA